MIQRPSHLGAFQFVVLATLRASQLIRGCRPLIDGGIHKKIVVAQLEVAEGKIVQVPRPLTAVGEPAGVPLENAAVLQEA